MEIADIFLDIKSDDNTVPDDCDSQKWCKFMLEAAKKFERPLDSPLFYKEQLAAAGFTNISETVYKWPTNTWPKDQKFKDMGELATFGEDDGDSNITYPSL